MKEYCFKEAKAVWLSTRVEEGSQLAGFYTHLSAREAVGGMLAIAARTYYRLYVNGRMYANGPARSARHFCRVDEIPLELSGETDLAIEVLAYGKPEKYSNDNTMEPGLLIAEVTDGQGRVLAATGKKGWFCQELKYRRMDVELMSQCRGITEYYDLTPDSGSWRTVGLPETPLLCEKSAVYLVRRAPVLFCGGETAAAMGRAYGKETMHILAQVADRRKAEHIRQDSMLELSRMVNPEYYKRVPAENLFLEELLCEEDIPFSGRLEREAPVSGRQYVRVIPGEAPAALLWRMERPEVGYLDLCIRVERETVADIVHSDALDRRGRLAGNTYASRYRLAPGEYHLNSFEPKLVKYAQIILRTSGEVRISYPEVLSYTYPDREDNCFECNDGDLNRIYEAARRTLRMNTLDLFMDCPERERGGWLCDSYFSARSAWQLFGDLSVEQDFLENYMLTDGDDFWHGFFPEVYPGVRGTDGDVGIRNWSFWLALEVCDYFRRTGDKEAVESWRSRIERFVDGMIRLRGGSGLLENLESVFVDWSLSNSADAVTPISIPVNCLAVYMLEQLSQLYGREDWRTAAEEIRSVIEALPQHSLAPKGDGAVWDGEGRSLKRKAFRTESGTALELFGGFHLNDPEYIRSFVEEMGPCPIHRTDPNIGKANLFIGLMVRFEVLARMGRTDVLVRELKDVYLEELRIGSGTLFEMISADSGCHGFNGYAAALIVNQVLGLGAPLRSTKTVRISPNPGKLLWACGSAESGDGPILFWWSADHEIHRLEMHLVLPQGWRPEYEIPFELGGWSILCNDKPVCSRDHI